ncbi:MAG: hypothetical protein JO249_05160 [Acidobacteria bacterium]|nr:hypothetical protein [Acidobacteriota bacterium]
MSSDAGGVAGAYVGIRRIWTRFAGNDAMIFGFNTDVKHGDTIYHVQSEARQAEFLFQTQVFVRGRCVGKRATSYAERAPDPFFTDKQKESLLRDQHRYVLDAIRDGRLEQVLDPKDAPESLAAIKQLDLEWINTDSVHSNRALILKIRVSDGRAPAPAAKLVSRVERPEREPIYCQAICDHTGTAEMKVELEESALADSAILVQADFNGRTATRKFRLKKV